MVRAYELLTLCSDQKATEFKEGDPAGFQSTDVEFAHRVNGSSVIPTNSLGQGYVKRQWNIFTNLAVLWRQELEASSTPRTTFACSRRNTLLPRVATKFRPSSKREISATSMIRKAWSLVSVVAPPYHQASPLDKGTPSTTFFNYRRVQSDQMAGKAYCHHCPTPGSWLVCRMFNVLLWACLILSTVMAKYCIALNELVPSQIPSTGCCGTNEDYFKIECDSNDRVTSV